MPGSNYPPVRLLAAGLGCALLAGCAPQFAGPPGEALKSARLACNTEYPQRVGNYLRHARCVNDAIEQYAVPTAHHPDLVRLQADVREHLSAKIDRRAISPQTGEKHMHEADALVAAAERDRDAGKDSSARHHIATLEAMLR
jgi:hypothetical protein